MFECLAVCAKSYQDSILMLIHIAINMDIRIVKLFKNPTAGRYLQSNVYIWAQMPLSSKLKPISRVEREHIRTYGV